MTIVLFTSCLVLILWMNPSLWEMIKQPEFARCLWSLFRPCTLLVLSPLLLLFSSLLSPDWRTTRSVFLRPSEWGRCRQSSSTPFEIAHQGAIFSGCWSCSPRRGGRWALRTLAAPSSASTEVGGWAAPPRAQAAWPPLRARGFGSRRSLCTCCKSLAPPASSGQWSPSSFVGRVCVKLWCFARAPCCHGLSPCSCSSTTLCRHWGVFWKWRLFGLFVGSDCLSAWFSFARPASSSRSSLYSKPLAALSFAAFPSFLSISVRFLPLLSSALMPSFDFRRSFSSRARAHFWEVLHDCEEWSNHAEFDSLPFLFDRR